MDDRNSTPLSRQLLPKIIAIILAIALLCVWLSLWFIQQQQTLNAQLSSALPHTQQALTETMARKALVTTLYQTSRLEQSTEVTEHFKTIKTTLRSLLTPQERTSSAILQFDLTKIERLNEHGDRNELIRQSAINQVGIIASALDSALSNRQTELEVNEPMSELVKLRVQMLQQLMTQLSLQLKSLNLQTSDADFDYLASTAEQIFNLLPVLAGHTELNEIAEQVYTLEQILMVEPRLIAKWRGYIRLYHQYVTAATDSIEPYLASQPFNKLKANEQLPAIAKMLHQVGIKVTAQQVSLGLLLLTLLNCAAIFVLFYMLYKAIKQHRVQLLSSVTDVIEGHDNSSLAYGSEDITAVCTKITQISKPLHTEEDYQALKKQRSVQLLNVAQLNATANWSLERGSLALDTIEYIESIVDEDGLASRSIRHLFTSSSLQTLIQAAREAKKSGHSQRVSVELRSGMVLTLSVLFEGTTWLGTLAKDEDKTELESENSILLEQQQVIKQQALQNTQKSYEKLANMLVQSMLQSQNVALVSGVSIQTSYRPLTRMFEWIRQQQILSRILLSNKPRQLQDVVLIDELHSAAFNVLTEAQLQQNKVLFLTDPHLATDVKLDARLFGRLLVAFCRLALKEQYKSTLQVSINAIDQNAGQQLVKFSAQVLTTKPLLMLPQHAQLLNDEALSVNHTGIESYFFGLFSLLHGKHLNAELTEQGYQISFELPIAVSKSQTTPSVELTKKSVKALVLCANKKMQKQLISDLAKVNISAEGLAKVTLFAEQFDLNYLNRHKLDLVVYAEQDKENVQSVLEHIASLPVGKQPKLVILQNSYQANLAKNGLFSLVGVPTCRDALIAEYEHLVSANKANNLLVSADEIKRFNFVPSQIEVLLAIKSPQQHQALWQLLQWFGFSVKVVCHSKAMQKHWQTGRYLVLLNEFETSPFIELNTGKSIARGVFSFSADEVIELDEKQAEIGRNWHLGVVPPVANVKSLTKLLAPWLKTSAVAQVRITEKEEHRIELAQSGDSTKATKAKGKRIAHERLFDSTLLEQLPPAFELDTYANNQGSPELAAYMLEEYITLLNEDMQVIENAIQDQTYSVLPALIKPINLTASILSAKGLLQVMLQLEHAHHNKAFDKMERLLEQAKIELSAIKTYADAI